MLIVVAMIGVLAGVAFIAVGRYLRSMTQLEYDGIAKEIFIAAQNHLTMAESQGYLQTNGHGSPESGSSAGSGDASQSAPQNGTDGIYYFVVNRGDLFQAGGSQVLKLMLPFGAVDETVRLGGSYVIRYQAQPAIVMDVFYSAPGERFGHAFTAGEYTSLLRLANDGAKAARRSYGGDVIGWYGGEEARNLAVGDRLADPEIEIINAARLLVKVTDKNNGAGNLKLLITGVTSGEKASIILFCSGSGAGVSDNIKVEANGADGTYIVTLDDITESGQHFAELLPGFLPGEDIRVQAIADNTSELTNIAYSAEKTTNSIFAALEPAEAESGSGSSGTGGDTEAAALAGTVSIANIRHLENLDARVSKLGITTEGAEQVNDLSWDGFSEELGEDTRTVSVYTGAHAGSTPTEAGCFLPVIPQDEIDYEGGLHKVEGITVNVAGDAGIFASLSGGSVKSLLVTQSAITSTGAAGAGDSPGGSAGSGNAGLLAGSVSGTKVKGCAAFGTVSAAAGDAGGLIGMTSDSTIEGCYTAGHTVDGAYPQKTDGSAAYDVTSSSGAAGGLVGSIAGNTTIIASYSTCSVSGGTYAGGFAGSAAGGSITDCYAAGLVQEGTNAGAFAGSNSAALSGCWYYEAVNELADRDKNGSVVYMAPVGGEQNAGESQTAGVTALDASAASYNAFVGAPDTWQDAKPKDEMLKTWYQGKYNLKSVSALLGRPTQTEPSGESAGTYEYEVFSTHYGDWPAPEIFVINAGGGTSAGSSDGTAAGG